MSDNENYGGYDNEEVEFEGDAFFDEGEEPEEGNEMGEGGEESYESFNHKQARKVQEHSKLV
jgi:hypothetical protein